jgi:hypothetical protein
MDNLFHQVRWLESLSVFDFVHRYMSESTKTN